MAKAGVLSPMLAHYMQVKEQYPDTLLLYRLGDFYELFFEDAKIASKELDIVLTSRDCGLSERAPMCGVPHHSVDSYIARLIERDHKVAICEQVSDPKASKGLVQREVVRVVTPGTVIDEAMLDETSNNYLLALFLDGDKLGYSFCDVSTGEFSLGSIETPEWYERLLDELGRIRPSEILVNDAMMMYQKAMHALSSAAFTSQYADWAFSYDNAEKAVLRQFKAKSASALGLLEYKPGVCAAGALLAYLNETQKNSLAHIRELKLLCAGGGLMMDASTRRNLELVLPLRTGGSKKHTLFGLLNATKTPMGARELKQWIEAPLASIKEIEARQGAVGELRDNLLLHDEIRHALDSIRDLSRLSSRIAYGSVTPRETLALRHSLEKLPGLMDALKAAARDKTLLALAESADVMEDVCALLADALSDDPPISVRDGGIFREGYDARIDEFRVLANDSQTLLSRMEAREREASGIKNLKIGYNRVFGYFFEVTKSQLELVPYHFIRKQTIANGERFITEELQELQEKITGAQEEQKTLEYEAFVQLRSRMEENLGRLQNSAQAVAQLDALQSLAHAARAYNYCRPEMRRDSLIEIVNGRHPVVERGMKDQFVPNPALLDGEENNMLIITGPNMAGKSTYMRQIALIVLMAHIGSFVPAESAKIALVDRICTRVGAQDDLAMGQSTFMVEMNEVANILRTATERSLLILDEIGRGTSTFDGLSIAWAVVEHIAQKLRAKTLFSTHYHELAELEGRLPGVKTYRISVKESRDDIIFLRRVMRGGSDKSFGIQVAKLAGVKDEIIIRAKEILHSLEQADINVLTLNALGAKVEERQMTLLPDDANALCEELCAVQIDALTPVNALNLLNEYHQRAKLIQK